MPKRTSIWLSLTASALLSWAAVTDHLRLGAQALGGEQAKESIRFVVRLPADAILMIDDYKTQETGEVRPFQTPPLPVGGHYAYTLKATSRGKEVTRKIHLAHDHDNTFDLRPEFLPSATTRPEAKHFTRIRLNEKEAREIGTEAYIYGYPLLTSEITRVQMTNVPKAEALRGPMGTLINLKRYPPADYRGVTAPNSDTLYSVAWLDLASEPWLLSYPDMGDRYFLFPIYSMWTPVIDSPGKRTAGEAGRTFAVTGPKWSGKLPEGVLQLRSPTRYVVILGRTYCTGTPEDYAAVHKLQSEYKVYPLSSYGKPYTPPPAKVDPKPGFSMTDKVRDVINDMDTETYFAMLARLMKDNPPLPEDGPIVTRMAMLGLVPGKDFKMSDLDPAVQAGLRDVGRLGFERISGHHRHAGTVQNGWLIPAAAGRYGTNYLDRAFIAAYGWGANLSQDAVYPSTEVDSDGKKLSGAHAYTLHFPREQTPPVNGFWSITMYDTGYFFCPNSLNRFTVSPRNKLKYNKDGSLDLYFQHESPGKDREANWLPAPKGDFILMMRMYWPKEEAPSILPPGSGTWMIPAVTRVAK